MNEQHRYQNTPITAVYSDDICQDCRWRSSEGPRLGTADLCKCVRYLYHLCPPTWSVQNFPIRDSTIGHLCFTWKLQINEHVYLLLLLSS